MINHTKGHGKCNMKITRNTVIYRGMVKHNIQVTKEDNVMMSVSFLMWSLRNKLFKIVSAASDLRAH